MNGPKRGKLREPSSMLLWPRLSQNALSRRTEGTQCLDGWFSPPRGKPSGCRGRQVAGCRWVIRDLGDVKLRFFSSGLTGHIDLDHHDTFRLHGCSSSFGTNTKQKKSYERPELFFARLGGLVLSQHWSIPKPAIPRPQSSAKEPLNPP